MEKLRNPASDPRYLHMEYAASRLKSMGFEFAFSSMRSEACYYGFPGLTGVIRVGLHRQSRREAATFKKPLITSIVFNRLQVKCIEEIYVLIWQATGRYFMATSQTTDEQKMMIDQIIDYQGIK
jgi:hypothetical protein